MPARGVQRLNSPALTLPRNVAQGPRPTTRARPSSLHLNLGECYRKLGDLDRAREHLQRGQAAAGALGSDSYGLMIKSGLDRLAERLACVRPGDGSLR